MCHISAIADQAKILEHKLIKKDYLPINAFLANSGEGRGEIPSSNNESYQKPVVDY